MTEVKIIKGKGSNRNLKRGIEVNSRTRVAAYCRVSTDKEDQLNSLETQTEHYKQMINNRDDWSLVEIYSDEGISGTQTIKRDGFNSLIRDCDLGKIDLVITKSISRFSRNIADTITYVRKLKDNNIGIIFENENLDTRDSQSEFLLSVLSSVAQQEVENISNNVNATLHHKMSNGVLVGNHRCLGYDYNPATKEISVNQEEAEIVKYIFRRYLEGDGCKVISKELEAKGYKTTKGNKHWNESTIRGIIKNDIYIGNLTQGKTHVSNLMKHKRKLNYGDYDKFEISEHHEAIIDADDFYKANNICSTRGSNRKGIGNPNGYRQFAFSRKLFCGNCGKIYSRRSNNLWQCVSYLKHGKENCTKSKAINEKLIESAFVEAFTNIVINNENGKALDLFLNDFETSINNTGINGQIKSLDRKISSYITNDEKLVDMKLNGLIDEESYKLKYKANKKDLAEARAKRNSLIELSKNNEQIKDRICDFRKELSDVNKIKQFDRTVFEALIEKVIIGGYTDNDNYDPFKITFIFKSGLGNKFGDKRIEYVANVKKGKLKDKSICPSTTDNSR